jgi:hypothetical protein
MFAIHPAATKLMLPGIHWVASAAKDFDTHDWEYGLEDNVIEFLHTCWQRESERISNDPSLREPFVALLAILVARGGHAAIALRDGTALSQPSAARPPAAAGREGRAIPQGRSPQEEALPNDPRLESEGRALWHEQRSCTDNETAMT